MAVTLAADKAAIFNILSSDPYLVDALGFSPKEMHRVPMTDALLGVSSSSKPRQQIFIYNASPEPTINPVIHGIVYEIDISVPTGLSGSADEAMEQILALLQGAELSPTHELEILEMPVKLPSETSLYQIGCRFICYESRYTKKKTYAKQESEA